MLESLTQRLRLTQHSDGLFPVIRGLAAAGITGPEGRPADARVGPPDGVDHAGVEEGQEEDWNGVEDEKAELVDWVTLIINILSKTFQTNIISLLANLGVNIFKGVRVALLTRLVNTHTHTHTKPPPMTRPNTKPNRMVAFSVN